MAKSLPKKNKKLRVLLTNDDGYFSDGLQSLYKALSKKHEVKIVAPDREQSASSHSLTLNRPLRVHQMNDHTWTTDGTPTDCVMLAMHQIYNKKRPDLVLSGINHGANMGDDIIYSGTVAAAVEGSLCGIKSIAVSMAQYEPGMRMKSAAAFVSKFITRLDRLEIDHQTVININFPADKGEKNDSSPYDDYEFTAQGFRHYQDVIISKKDPRGKPYFWIGGRAKWRDTKGTDFAAVKRGMVSITPIKLDFTDNDVLERFGKIDLKL